MTSRPSTSKRWRSQFSVRTFVILVTLVCCYAACWGPTKSRGVRDLKNYYSQQGRWIEDDNISTRAPLIIRADDWVSVPGMLSSLQCERHYYLWFFGYVAELHPRSEKPEDHIPDKFPPPFQYELFRDEPNS